MNETIGSYEIVVRGPEGEASIMNTSRPRTAHKLVVRLLQAAVPFHIVHRWQVIDRKGATVGTRERYVPLEAWTRAVKRDKARSSKLGQVSA